VCIHYSEAVRTRRAIRYQPYAADHRRYRTLLSEGGRFRFTPLQRASAATGGEREVR
jgi:hypothetical protein